MLSLPLLAGGVYIVAWIIGLLLQPDGAPEIDAASAAVAAHFEAEANRQALNSLLVHGVTATALILVALLAVRFAYRHGQQPLGRALFVAAAIGAIVSFVQLALGITLASTADATQPERSGTLFDAINRLDGVKMLAFAAMAAAGAVLAIRRTFPRWLGIASVLLAIALIVSAVGYLLLEPSLALAAFVSLPLLLVWVGGVTIVIHTRGRVRSPDLPPASAQAQSRDRG